MKGAREPSTLVVMGVSASGKSRVSYKLARRCGYVYLDADWFHPAAIIAKMSSGQPLTDEDRWPWLAEVGRCAHAVRRDGYGVVVACSALKRSYRDALRQHVPEMVVIYLDVPRTVLEERVARRKHHFMPASLLQSQLDTLEPPDVDEMGLRVTEGSKAPGTVKHIISRLELAKA